jgi:hypothetical protein
LATLGNNAARNNFLGEDFEPCQLCRAKARRNRNICGIPPIGNNNAADTGSVMPGVKGKPPPSQEHLEPRAEIHRGGVRWYADTSKVARAVSSGDIHAATQSHGEVCEIATHANPLTIRIEGRSVVTRVRISKFDVIVDEVADRLNPLPPWLCCTKRPPCKIRESLRVTVPATQQINEDVIWQCTDWLLLCVNSYFIRFPWIANVEIGGELHRSRRGDYARTNVPKCIPILTHWSFGRGRQLLFR